MNAIKTSYLIFIKKYSIMYIENKKKKGKIYYV